MHFTLLADGRCEGLALAESDVPMPLLLHAALREFANVAFKQGVQLRSEMGGVVVPLAPLLRRAG